MFTRLFLVVLATVFSACTMKSNNQEVHRQTNSVSTITVPKQESITVAASASPVSPLFTPTISSLYERIPLEFTSFHETRRTPTCSHSVPSSMVNSSDHRLTLDQLRNTDYLTQQSFDRIALKNGKYVEPSLLALSITNEQDKDRLGTVLTEPVYYGDIDANGIEDAVVILITWSGGTGFWRDIVVVRNNNGSPTSVATIYLADRDVVNDIMLHQSDIIITVTPKSSSAQEKKIFRLCGNVIVEISS